MKIERLIGSKKMTAGLLVVVGIIAFTVFAKPSLDTCFTVYTPTLVPQGQKVAQINVEDLNKPCENRSAWFADSQSNQAWEIEEAHATHGPKKYRFDITHMDFREANGGRYTFVTDRDGNPALLGFIDNTFIYITNAKEGALSKEDMTTLFTGLKKQ